MSLCKVRGPVAWVLSLARLNWMSGASVEAVRAVSAPPTSERRAEEPLVRAAELMATVPVAVMPESVRLPEMRVSPFTLSVDEGEVEAKPRRLFVESQKRFALLCPIKPPAPKNGIEPSVIPVLAKFVTERALRGEVAVVEVAVY